MAQSLNDTYTLSNGVEIPVMGLGVYKNVDEKELSGAIKTALDTGYRHIDTAMLYHNEQGVGEALRQSDVKREDIFVTTKLWNTDHNYDKALSAYEKSLERLGLEYADLYLIHWPMPGTYVEAYQALETLYEEGKVRAIGVSNFHQHHLEEIMKVCKVTPMVNQVEYHPHLPQKELKAFCDQHDILMEAWSPLKRGRLFEEPLLLELAEKYEKTPAQIILRWDIQNGVSTIPKSVTPHRIRENAEVFDFSLSDEDMEKILSLENGERAGKNPDHVTLETFGD